ncbi:hypothetical protein [Croceivirga sp. JEA036]|uniref:hypothetical protein n=1 Tax=Croceivirga sp. JEA036 TaxID=2721162 RepID=UPI00143A162F|nr:hypothetical protein [Croceivirga sp. JEA036]NJB38135.1 hypothetical protein [Croceivirga sp. JEA036]
MGLNDMLTDSKRPSSKPNKTKKQKIEKSYKSYLVSDETSGLIKKVTYTLKIQGKKKTTSDDILNEAITLMAKKYKIDVD